MGRVGTGLCWAAPSPHRGSLDGAPLTLPRIPGSIYLSPAPSPPPSAAARGVPLAAAVTQGWGELWGTPRAGGRRATTAAHAPRPTLASCRTAAAATAAVAAAVVLYPSPPRPLAPERARAEGTTAPLTVAYVDASRGSVGPGTEGHGTDASPRAVVAEVDCGGPAPLPSPVTRHAPAGGAVFSLFGSGGRRPHPPCRRGPSASECVRVRRTASGVLYAGFCSTLFSHSAPFFVVWSVGGGWGEPPGGVWVRSSARRGVGGLGALPARARGHRHPAAPRRRL